MNKIRIVLALMAIMAYGAVSARELSVVEQKDRYGYSDESGKIVIKPQFSRAYPFENGVAKVCKNNKWGYIDQAGKQIIPIVYDNIEPFEKGLARVKKGNKYGYIKENGTIYIKPEYDFIGSFNDDGWLWVAKGKSLSQSVKGLYRNDKLVIKPSASSYYLGFYVTTDSIDYTKGMPISTTDGMPMNNEIKQNFSKLSESPYPYIWTKAYGAVFQICDLDGKLLAKQQNAAIGMPKNGWSITRSYSKKKKDMFYHFNFISADGKSKKLFKDNITQKLDPDNIYEACSAFNNGFAVCGTGNNAYIINTAGRQVSSTYSILTAVDGNGYIACMNGRYGFIAESGNEVVAPKYSIISPSFEGSCVYAAQDPDNKKYGFINFSGEVIIPFRFDNAKAFADGKAYVQENGLYGVVDNQGEYIVKNQWSNILPAKEKGIDYIWVQDKLDKKWKCLQISRDELSFNDGFDNVDSFDSKGRAIVETNKVYGAVDTNGASILPMRLMSYVIAKRAIDHLDDNGKNIMTDADAYRFNIYNNDQRHTYKLHQTIDPTMWDY